MRTAGNRVALLLAAVLASGSALLTAGAASAQQQAITATVNGAKIQKVGFRAMIQKETIMYNLAGFARNKPDVEAVAALMALIEGRTDDGKVVAMWAPGRTPQPGLAWAIRIKPNDVTFHEETDSPIYADRRNFQVEKWSRYGLRVELMLYAGNNLDTARRIFERTTKHRPRVRLTIRQRMRVLDEWPRHETLL